MVWLYVGLFIASFMLRVLGLPSWTQILLFVLFSVGIFYKLLYPLFFGRNASVIMEYLKKSRNPHYQFVYHFFAGNLDQAEKKIQKVKSKQLKIMDQVLLSTKKMEYSEAKSFLSDLKESDYKWYYRAVIAAAEGDEEEYETNKSKLKDSTFLSFLQIEEMFKSGNKKEALALVEHEVKRLRGVKLLTVTHYQEELLAR